jgi:hypothetical protein
MELGDRTSQAARLRIQLGDRLSQASRLRIDPAITLDRQKTRSEEETPITVDRLENTRSEAETTEQFEDKIFSA